MKKTLFFFFILGLVAAILAGGATFVVQHRALSELKARTKRAEDLITAKNYDEAIVILKEVEQQKRTPGTAFLLGKCYQEKDRQEEAMRYFTDVDRRDPNSSYAPESLLIRARYQRDYEQNPNAARDLFLAVLARFPDTVSCDHALVDLARISLAEGNEAQARRNLELVLKKSESPARSDAEFLIGDLNMKDLKSADPKPGDDVYTIKKGDTLWEMERKLKVPGDLIVAINGINPRALSVGTQLKVPKLNISVVIDKPSLSLTLRNNGTLLKKYHISLNRDDTLLPPGEYSVQKKYEKGRDYVDPVSNTTLKPGDPNNPLGSRFIELRRDIGIHGTNDPEKIGSLITRGCIALTNQDVEELYGLVQIKPATVVTVKGHIQPEGKAVTRK